MDLQLPANAVPFLYAGTTFFDLFPGTSVYGEARAGQELTVKAGDADVTVRVDNIQIGPFGQFLAPNHPHIAHIGRAHDVRAIVDHVENANPDDPKVLDPRAIYTAVFFNVVSVA